MQLSDKDIDRYSRNIILPEIGGGGQYKLLQSKVLVIGMGGLGSPLLMYLAAAGIGNCLLYTSPSPRDGLLSRMPSSA